jgi:hypothetical protein
VKQNFVAILFVLLMSAVVLGQENRPTPAEECRIVTAADLFDSEAPSFGG